MKFTIGLYWLFIPFISCLNQIDIDFSINYMKTRHINAICLLTCDSGNTWTNRFTKYANSQSISVFKVEIDKILNDYALVDICLERKLTSNGVLINACCRLYENILIYASENMYFDSRHKWLVIGHRNVTILNSGLKRNETVSGVIEIFNHLNLSVDADIVLSTSTIGSTAYKLYDIYNFGKIQGGDLVIDELGSWNSDSGFNLKININDYKYYRRWDFQRTPLKLINVLTEPTKVFNPKILTDLQPDLNIPVIITCTNRILHDIAEIHNFRFIYTISDRWYGDFTRNSSKAVASSLYFRTQDISPLIRFIHEALTRIDIIHPPLTSIEIRYYYRIPTRGVGKFQNQFLTPLSQNAWLSVLFIATLCLIVLLLAAKFEERPSYRQYAVLSVIASICQQFFEDNEFIATRRASLAREMTIFITGIFCVLIYNYYTSSVVSWLLNGPPPSITSLEELLDSPLELIFEDIGYTRSWLQVPNYYYNSRNQKVENQLRQKKVFNKKKGAPLFEPVEKGIAMVKSGGYAYHTDMDTANKLISRSFTQAELCELGSLQSMEKTNLYACVQKDSPFKEFFVWSVARLSERGIISCIQRRTNVLVPKCEGSSPRALALGGASPAFLLLAIGYFLATIIMLLERVVKRTKGRPQTGNCDNDVKRKYHSVT
ncbi:uncharacterized protein LOC113509766 [Galleria mellonella]|uniref:Uncharacterized protein LOC113509766 n=1 Tax=Galleria mellonella TaxID=7137 RepID=A0ABM3N7C8_GALME|nr:uncharacterized protein LOC113509766 [Galleria mellonella]